ncbi:MAG: hypothetical protein WBA44_17510 [Mesorhizobium sp.]
MTVACDQEFKSVLSLIESGFESRGVDAFCVAWIKYERQLRKLAAHLIYQSAHFDRNNQAALRTAFLANTGMSHTSARGCFWRLTGTSINELIGLRYAPLNHSMNASFRAREKIFHGQQTGDSLNRAQLIGQVQHIQEWCQLLSDAAQNRFGYDGFSGPTSLFKQDNDELTQRVDRELAKLGWEEFVRRL